MSVEWRGPDFLGRHYATIDGFSIVRRSTDNAGYEYSGFIDWHPTAKAAVEDVRDRPRSKGTYL